MKYLLVLISFFVGLTASAQEYEVVSFDVEKTDLTARTNPRVDSNGRKCAVIKVYVDDQIAAVRGAVIGEVASTGMEKLVYMSHDAKTAELVFDNHYPLKIVFEDFGYPAITGQMTYILKLKPKSETINKIPNDTISKINQVPFPISNIGTIDAIDWINSLEKLKLIFGCELDIPSQNDLAKIKQRSGVKVVNLGDGPFKDAGIKKNFIISKINDYIINSIEDIVHTYGKLTNSNTTKEKTLLLKGYYPNGKKAYYAVVLKMTANDADTTYKKHGKK